MALGVSSVKSPACFSRFGFGGPLGWGGEGRISSSTVVY